MSYMVDYFKEMGFSVDEVIQEEYIPMVDVIRIRNENPRVYTFLKWPSSQKNDQLLKTLKPKLRSILRKGVKFDSEVYSYERLEEFVNSYYPLLTPEEKIDKVLEYISSLSSYDGEIVSLRQVNDDLAYDLLFNGLKEWEFYRHTAMDLGLIKRYVTGASTAYNLSIEGLTRIITLKERMASRTCFIAMAFQDDMDVVYMQCIAPIVIECGFEPYIVNRVHMASDETINDGIIAGIKKARFTIADFTHLKAGVYFEAGYALGRGQKVIYSCREDFIDKLHFDLRNYQVIVWKDVDDFKMKLRDKIEAFIMD